MDKEAIFMLLNGLPDTPQWVVFRSLTIGLYSSANVVTSPSMSMTSLATTVSFKQVATSFTEEANRQQSHLKMARPGSEYTNSANTLSWGPDRKTSNPTTGVRIHKQNPKGVPCDNPVCTGLPCSLTHDRAHYLQQGGGMEGKGPWAQ